MEEKRRIQQRELLIREFEDEIEFDATMWKIPVKKSEAKDFFLAWLNGSLKESSYFDNRKPRILGK